MSSVGSSPAASRAGSFGTRAEALRGVNLGGWLVLERWMTPGLFREACGTAQDERSLLHKGGEDACALVKEHRDNFISEEDFAWLATEGGVNTIRLPVGFWCFEEHAAGTPFLPTRDYVDKAFEWAHSHGLKILLDFHGAQGSQNARDHSGDARGSIRWLEPRNRQKNLQVLLAWAQRWGRHPAFFGLGLANEVEDPLSRFSEKKDQEQDFWTNVWAGLVGCRPEQVDDLHIEDACNDYWDEVLHFYEDVARLVRPHMHSLSPLVVDTCWDMSRWEDGRLSNITGPVWLDYHHYQCYGGDEERIHMSVHSRAEGLLDQLLHRSDLPVIIGEFSLALSPRTPGYMKSGWQHKFWEQQVGHAARHSAGFFFWNYRLGRDDFSEWSYRACVEKGWIDTVKLGLIGDVETDAEQGL